MKNAKRHRILYIEKPTFVGGSITGLYETISCLDKSRFEPVMLFHGPNPYRDKFQALGVRVMVLSEEVPNDLQVESVRDIAGTLSRVSSWLGDTYRVAKQAQTLWRQGRPVAHRIAAIIKAHKIDLVHHNNSPSGNLYTIWGASLAGVPQISHIRMMHDFGFWEHRLAHNVNLFIYMSKAIERHYQRLGLPSGQGRVIYDPFDFQAYSNLNHRQALRSALGVNGQDQIICNVGRLDWWKGHDYFLQAMGQVVKTKPNAKALIVGEPDSTALSQAYYQQLQHLVETLNLTDNVIFTGFRTDVPALMAASEVIIHSASEPEPFGRVVVEAMAASRPVIATAAGGVLDIVKDRETGLLVPPKDASAMAEAICYLLDNRDHSEAMGQAGRGDAERRFSGVRHIAQIHDVYEQLLGA